MTTEPHCPATEDAWMLPGNRALMLDDAKKKSAAARNTWGQMAGRPPGCLRSLEAYNLHRSGVERKDIAARLGIKVVTVKNYINIERARAGNP